jgi:hypothetical protein
MKNLLLTLGMACVVLAETATLPSAQDKDEARGQTIKYQVHRGYFESNKSGLKGDVSFLAFTEEKAFDKIFGKAFVLGKKPNFLPRNAFESNIAFATIKRGGTIWTYKVDKVTADEGTLYVQYEASANDGGGARFASPLIVSVDKGKYSKVVFIENGKRAGTADIEKQAN